MIEAVFIIIRGSEPRLHYALIYLIWLFGQKIREKLESFDYYLSDYSRIRLNIIQIVGPQMIFVYLFALPIDVNDTVEYGTQQHH